MDCFTPTSSSSSYPDFMKKKIMILHLSLSILCCYSRSFPPYFFLLLLHSNISSVQDGRGPRRVPSAFHSFARAKQREFWQNMATSMGMGLAITFTTLFLYRALDGDAIVAVVRAMVIALAVTLALSFLA